MDITLERYHGLGNDYLVYDPNKNELELNEENVKMQRLISMRLPLFFERILSAQFLKI